MGDCLPLATRCAAAGCLRGSLGCGCELRAPLLNVRKGWLGCAHMSSYPCAHYVDTQMHVGSAHYVDTVVGWAPTFDEKLLREIGVQRKL